MVKKCPHCGKEILEFIQGCCPLCGVYRVVLPEPEDNVEADTAKPGRKPKEV